MNKVMIAAIIVVLIALGASFFFGWPFSRAGISNRVEEAVVTQSYDHSPLELEDQVIIFSDETEATFHVAKGFELSLVAEDLGKARFLTKSQDGRLFVPDMVDWNDNTNGSIYILENWNEETGRFEGRHTYLTGLRNPHSLAFYKDAGGQDWLYVALTDKLVRYPYTAGDTAPSGEAETIAEFPDYRTVDGDAWHITRTLLFDGNILYVSVGSSCNSCEEPEDEIRAEVITMNADGSDIKSFATGLRNAVGLAEKSGEIYATNNGPDHLGEGVPDDGIYRLEAGRDYGFPYCYETKGELKADETKVWEREPIDCNTVPKLFASFGAHTAPLGLTYIGSGDPRLTDSFLVALHGSFLLLPSGYSVNRVLPDGTNEVLVDGFLLENGERTGRPVHILQWDDNTFFISDDFNGRIYRLEAVS